MISLQHSYQYWLSLNINVYTFDIICLICMELNSTHSCKQGSKLHLSTFKKRRSYTHSFTHRMVHICPCFFLSESKDRWIVVALLGFKQSAGIRAFFFFSFCATLRPPLLVTLNWNCKASGKKIMEIPGIIPTQYSSLFSRGLVHLAFHHTLNDQEMVQGHLHHPPVPHLCRPLI